ncbi:hypothetical protein GWI33_007304 [Rhynchophorus ferrugineus]|uniref:Uncharacterized protein n=1 Tax=Rhynchophorus ferrugineus TaxID=354439 RepID=A0A834MD61_RHYFE|nr:hypothetical protein GWI33_007304 [Rhynchophorus ferrugineus]
MPNVCCDGLADAIPSSRSENIFQADLDSDPAVRACLFLRLLRLHLGLLRRRYDDASRCPPPCSPPLSRCVVPREEAEAQITGSGSGTRHTCRAVREN